MRRWSQSSPATTEASRRQPLPAGGGREPAGVEDRSRRQPREHVLAPVAAGGEGQQIEQRAARHPRGEGHDGGAVGGDAGGVELLVGEARVGLGAGVQHRDAIEPGAGAHGVDDGPHGGAHLLVAVGRGDHQRAVGRDRRGIADRLGAVGVEPETAQGVGDLGVGLRHAREPGDHRGGDVLGQRDEEAGAVLRRGAGAGARRARPSAATAGAPARLAAAVSRSSSSYQRGSSRARVARWRRTTSPARSLEAAMASRAAGERSRSSR